MKVGTAAAALTISLCLAESASAGGVIVPYGDCAWRCVMTQNAFDPAALSKVSYDDSWWTLGCAPFVAPWGCVPGGTLLAGYGHVLIRRHIYNHGGPTVAHYAVRARWEASASMNGRTDVSWSGPQTECYPNPVIANSFLLQPGDNAIVLVTRFGPPNYGGNIDVEITADDPTPTAGSSWGRLKLTYR